MVAKYFLLTSIVISGGLLYCPVLAEGVVVSVGVVAGVSTGVVGVAADEQPSNEASNIKLKTAKINLDNEKPPDQYINEYNNKSVI